MNVFTKENLYFFAKDHFLSSACRKWPPKWLAQSYQGLNSTYQVRKDYSRQEFSIYSGFKATKLKVIASYSYPENILYISCTSLEREKFS